MYYTILILLFAGTCLVAGNPAADSAHEIKSSIDHVHSSVLNHHVRLPFFHDNGARRKRQADWYSDDSYLDESTLCLLRCTNQLKAATRHYSTSVTDLDDENDMTKPNFNLTRFTKICEAMRPPIQCYDRCPSSSLMTQVRDMLDPLRYMCVDRYEDIKSNAKCMHKLAAVTNAQCVPRCREFESALNRTRQFARRPYLRYLYSTDDVRDMLSGTCQYIQCNLDCSVPVTRRVCGDTAAELVTSITQKLMASLQNYDSLATNGQFLPEECRRLAQPSESRDEAGRDQQAEADEYVEE